MTKLLATSSTHALHREQILDFLWPGVDLDSALNSFGKALHAARRALEPELLPRQSSTYLRLTDSILALTEKVVVDADRFEQLAEDALRRRKISSYESALAAYGGELLPEDRYADWCTERRSFLAELRVRLLLGLADALDQSGAYNESADRLRQVLQHDPTREEIHRRLIRLYAEMGTPDQSVRQFHLCEQVLRRELDLAPQHETVSLYHDVIANKLPERRALPERSSHPDWSSRRERGSKPERDRALVGFRRLPISGHSPDAPLVGRGAVLRDLCQHLSRADQAGVGMLLVSGEAGVGKTRLVQEFAAKASGQGAAVLWGGAGAHAKTFAYGPFAVALEGYAASLPEGERNELARRHPALARFVASLGTDSELPVRSADASDDRLELILSIVRLLTELGRERPVLFVFGDLNGADRASLDLLGYLVQLSLQKPWLMIATVREEEVQAGTELRQMIATTLRERLCEKIDLHCIAREECDQLVRSMLPATDVRDELLHQIYTRSRGNPLFIEDLVRETHQGNGLLPTTASRHHASWLPAAVPTRVRALATMTLAPVDDTVRRVLGLIAAASATEISLNELRTGTAALKPAISDAALLDALDRALESRLLEERNSGYAFRHPLVRSTLYQNLPQHRRDQLHEALNHPQLQNPHQLHTTAR